MIYEIYILAFPQELVSLQEKFYEFMDESAGAGLAGAACLEASDQDEMKEKMTKLFTNMIKEGGEIKNENF